MTKKHIPVGRGMNPAESAVHQLAAWGRWAERLWYDVPGRPRQGCFGTGYGEWGTQTNQKYLAAMATLAARGPAADRDWAQQRALAALRYELATHLSGEAKRTDGSQWGRNCFSALGLERMMHAWPCLEPHVTGTDRADLRRVLMSEAQWAMDEHTRHGRQSGVFGGLWGGLNAPESNLWEGALLWRVTAMYPDHERADEFRERAHQFLINAVSIPADAESTARVAGKMVKERHAGANFFPHYALDHHGYLNVGYMVICTSNAAMLHFDLKRLGLDRPESLDHHQRDLWQVIRRLTFGNGRLARIGGDSRLPYTYCQEYLVPALLYAADHLGDEQALGMLSRQLDMIYTESRYNGDGSFYSGRLGHMAVEKPFYYSRLESDRAVVLSMLATYWPLLNSVSAVEPDGPSTQAHETTVAGGWIEPEHGAVMHRSPTRFASVAWRAYDWPQVLCLPPDDGHLADWRSNLVGVVRCLGDDGIPPQGQTATRRLIRQCVSAFEGGFLAAAVIAEGDRNFVPESLTLMHQATSYLAVCALPDAHTVIVLHRCVANIRVFTHEVKGLHLSLPNDLFNGFTRTLTTDAGVLTLRSPAEKDAVCDLQSRWACIDARLGVIGLYGAESLSVHRVTHRRGGKFHALYTEELCWPCLPEMTSWDAGATILDVGYVVQATVGAEQVRRTSTTAGVDLDAAGGCRRVTVTGQDGVRYQLVANLTDHPHHTHELAPGAVVLSKADLPGESAIMEMTP